jgi:hypothetical protein
MEKYYVVSVIDNSGCLLNTEPISLNEAQRSRDWQLRGFPNNEYRICTRVGADLMECYTASKLIKVTKGAYTQKAWDEFLDSWHEEQEEKDMNEVDNSTAPLTKEDCVGYWMKNFPNLRNTHYFTPGEVYYVSLRDDGRLNIVDNTDDPNHEVDLEWLQEHFTFVPPETKENHDEPTHIRYIGKPAEYLIVGETYKIISKSDYEINILDEDDDPNNPYGVEMDNGEFLNPDDWEYIKAPENYTIKITDGSSNVDKQYDFTQLLRVGASTTKVTQGKKYLITDTLYNKKHFFVDDSGNKARIHLNEDGAIYSPHLWEYPEIIEQPVEHFNKLGDSYLKYVKFTGTSTSTLTNGSYYRILGKSTLNGRLKILSDIGSDGFIDVDENNVIKLHKAWSYSKDPVEVTENYSTDMLFSNTAHEEERTGDFAEKIITKLKENKMNDLSITNPTLINGTDAVNFSEEKLIDMIQVLEGKISNLSEMTTVSTKVAKIIKGHEASIKKLVKILDARK